MKRVRARMLTYDAAEGRIEIGQEYLVEDDKAERWIQAGIATEAPPKPPAPDPAPIPPPPEPLPEEPEDEGGESDEEQDPEQLRADVHKLYEAGASERAIAQQLGISRTRVHSLLSG